MQVSLKLSFVQKKNVFVYRQQSSIYSIFPKNYFKKYVYAYIFPPFRTTDFTTFFVHSFVIYKPFSVRYKKKCMNNNVAQTNSFVKKKTLNIKVFFLCMALILSFANQNKKFANTAIKQISEYSTVDILRTK